MPRVVLLCSLLAACLAAPAVVLVKDGKPMASIVITDEAFTATPYIRTIWGNGSPAAKVRLAANELQSYLQQITGATLPIVSDSNTFKPGQPLVLVGESALTKDVTLRYPRGVTKDFLEEGYGIATRGNVLVLAGNDEGPYHGTEYAVVDLLYRLGARWYMPTAYGEYLPVLSNINLTDLNVTETPDFRQRGWWQNATAEMQAADAEYKLHNRAQCDPPIAVAGDGTLRNWMPPAELMQTKPEYFAKTAAGGHDPNMINLTHPDTPGLVAEKMKVEIKKQLDQGAIIPQVSIAPDDGAPIDYTPETMQQNSGFTELAGRLNVPTEVSISEEWFRFVNKVAEAVVKDYPNALILTNGYSNRNIPPEGVALHPNVSIMYAAIWADAIHALNNPRSWQTNIKADIMQRWCQLCPRTYIYDYDMQMLVTAVTPVPGVRKVAAGMPLMKQMGLAGFWSEARTTYIEEGIATKYLRTRMMWDANLNVETVLDDYYRRWYGTAAKSMRTFWDALETAMETTNLLGHEDRVLPFVYTPALLATLEKCAAEAERLPNSARAQEHIKVDRYILEHLRLYMAMHAAEFNGDYAQAAQCADGMWAMREKLAAISPFLCTSTGS
ncbi:MAG TPA: DUF4838 domain-containing protein, partial [Armatimonadota bacterium]|nr:DUF4838 domain-containing protein [Armatimonadota bacterium]